MSLGLGLIGQHFWVFFFFGDVCSAGFWLGEFGGDCVRTEEVVLKL